MFLKQIIMTGMAVLVLAGSTMGGQKTNKPKPGKLINDKAREQEFMDWGLGMFIHFGVDVSLGSVISHSMVGASDAYLKRFVEELPAYFNPKDYNPEEWVLLAKLAGMRYMVFGTKHHSGFCLWPTKTTDFSVANTPYKKDIVKEFVDACRKHDMKIGLYFSPEDFLFMHNQGHEIRRRSKHANISTNPGLLAHDMAQIKELFTNYGPIDLAFLDAFDHAALVQQIHELQPQCIVTRGEMATPEQKVPDKPVLGPWEACFTLGNQWQYKPTNEEYKSGTDLINMLIDIRAKGGNLLINMGPDPLGRMPDKQERIFRELALWMFVNRDAIHDIRTCPLSKEGDLWFTRPKDKKNDIYVLIPQGSKPWKRGSRRSFTLKSLKANSETKISVLGQNSRVVEYSPKAKPEARVQQTKDGLKLSIVRAQRLYNNHKWHNPIVVKLENVEFD